MKQKLFYAVAGFFVAKLLLIGLLLGFSYSADNQSIRNQISADEALKRIQFTENKGINIKIENRGSEPVDELFRIIFILFLISPPIIVVLLLVIISKMNKKNKMK